MSKNLSNHWAICDKEGSVRYDEFGRAEIYESRTIARSRSAGIFAETGERVHVEKVTIW